MTTNTTLYRASSDGCSCYRVAAHETEYLLGNEAFIDKIVAKDASFAKRIMKKIADLKKAFEKSGDTKSRAEIKQLEQAEKLYLSAAEKVGGARLRAFIQGQEPEEESVATDAEIRYSFAGKKAKTAHPSKLATAMQMTENGIDSEIVRKETGWFKGYDGKWRFEIGDLESRLVGESKLQRHMEDGEIYYTAKMADILEHDALFEAYPELKEYTVIIQKTEPFVQGTSFPKNKQIVLAKELFEKPTPEYAAHLTSGDEVLKIEKTPEYKEYSDFYETESEDVEAWLAEEKRVREKFFSSELGKRYYQLKWGKFTGQKYKPGWSNQARTVLIHEIQHAIQYIEGFSGGSNEYYWKKKISEGYQTDKSPSDLYYSTAGEIEARDAGYRVGFTAEERQEKRPDIDRSEVVFIDEQGTSMSIVELTNGKKYVKANKQVIFGTDSSKWAKQVSNFINDEIRNWTDFSITTDEGDILTITKDTAYKAGTRNTIKNPDGTYRAMTDAEYSAKLNAEVHINEIAQISKKNSKSTAPDTKQHRFAKDGFTYRTAYFEDFNGEYYKITISIGHNGAVATIYNVGKIEKNTMPYGKIKTVYSGSEANTVFNRSIPQNSQDVNTISKKSSNDVKYSLKEISISDVETLRSIERKSINEFSNEDIEKAEPWAKKFYAELGTKSPFFRAWFGDWRAYDQSKIKTVTVENIDLSDVVMQNGEYTNPDTGWNITAGRTLKKETQHYARGEKVSIKALNDIQHIIENAVLLDTEISKFDSNQKSNSTAFMHKLYTPILYKEKLYIAKISVEEYLDKSTSQIKRKGYHLRSIKIETADGRSVDFSTTAPRSDTISINSISDLHALVKTYDKDFSPKVVNPVLLNEDGTPKVFYHGTNAKFTEFKPEELREREGSYFFAENREDAAAYGKNIMEVYISSENLADYDNQPSEFYKLENKRKQVEWLKERGFDGWYADMDSGGWGEISVFNPTQIKSATDNIGTFNRYNSDIHYSLKEVDDMKVLSNSLKAEAAASLKPYRYELSGGKVKQDAEYTRERVYTKKEAEGIINDIVGRFMSFGDSYGVLSGKSRSEVVELLWRGLNAAEPDKRSKVALDVAEYIIQYSAIESIHEDPALNVHMDTVNLLKPYLHSIDLTSILQIYSYSYPFTKKP